MPYRMDTAREKFTHIITVPNSKCLNCGRDLYDSKMGFCDYCLKNISLNSGKICKRCGVAILGEEDFCGRCNFEEIYFYKAYSAMIYEGSLIQAIYQVKYGGFGLACGIFANYLVFLTKRYKIDYDVVCYVPMTKAKVSKRGFNQARLLAEYFCDILETKNLSHCLEKIRETEQQEKLNQKERMENVKGVYAVKDASEVLDKTVLLIDDVKTTGSTLNECAKVLKKAGAKRVICITVASRRQLTDFIEGEKDVDFNQDRKKDLVKRLSKDSQKKRS